MNRVVLEIPTSKRIVQQMIFGKYPTFEEITKTLFTIEKESNT